MVNRPLADQEAERALLTSIFLNANYELLELVESRDFTDPLLAWLIGEWQLMVADGEPLGDAVAFSRWTRRGDVLRRLFDEALGMDRRDVIAAWAEISKEYAGSAHDAYYFRVLRNERCRRALALVLERAAEKDKDSPHDPAGTIDWCLDQLERLRHKLPRLEPQLVTGEEE